MGDEPVGCGENVGRRAVVLLQADDLRAGEVAFEAQDVGDFGAAPGIDRLVVVADAAQIAARLGEELQPFVLRLVGVLIFVDEDVAETVAVAGEHVGLVAEDHQHVEQQVAEVAGVEGLQALLILRVEFRPAPGGEGFRFARVDLGRGPAAVLPAVDESGELARGPALLVEVRRADQLLHDSQLVVGVEDGEVGMESDELGVASKHFGRDRVEGAEPRHPLDRSAGNGGDPVLHLARGLVGEGDRQDMAGPRLPSRDEMSESRRQRGRLAGACSGEDEDRPFRREHGLALRGVEALEIGGLRAQRGRFRRVLRHLAGGRERRTDRQLSGRVAEGSNGCSRYPRYPQASYQIFCFRDSEAMCMVTK